jgi:predicted amidophosphoribosyltransferase
MPVLDALEQPLPPQEDALCAHCGQTLPAGARFCGKCGTAAPPAVYCFACGRRITPDSAFCSICGAKQTVSPGEEA